MDQQESLLQQKLGKRYKPNEEAESGPIPTAFAVSTKRTYEHVEQGKQQQGRKVWNSQLVSGLYKRQCTLQVCFRPTGIQSRLGIIFFLAGEGDRKVD